MLEFNRKHRKLAYPLLIGLLVGLSGQAVYQAGKTTGEKEGRVQVYETLANAAAENKDLDLGIEAIEAIHQYKAKVNEHQAKQKDPLPSQTFSADAYIHLFELQRSKLWSKVSQSGKFEETLGNTDTSVADTVIFDGIQNLSDLEAQKLLEYTKHLFDNKEPIPVDESYSPQVNNNIRFFYYSSLGKEKLERLKACRDKLNEEYGEYGALHLQDTFDEKTGICEFVENEPKPAK